MNFLRNIAFGDTVLENLYKKQADAARGTRRASAKCPLFSQPGRLNVAVHRGKICAKCRTTKGVFLMKKTTRAMLFMCLALLLLTAFSAHAQPMPITGPVLVGSLPLEAEITRDFSDEQGNYLQELLVFDGAMRLTTLRQNIDGAHPIEMPMRDFLSEHFSDMRDEEPLDTEPVAAYPTERLRFTTGANEDTTVIDAVLIRTDAYYFAFWASAQIDMYYGYCDPFDEGEIPEMIDLWIESLNLFDAGDAEPPYWNGLDFGPNVGYAEEYPSTGDSGDYLNAAEAARLTFDAMRENGNIPEYSDDAQYVMVLVDIADIAGEECYVYRLDAYGFDGAIGAAYAYAYQSGTIFMQGHGGQWLQP
jgi:ribosomal protein S18 acetylase RimI-like enzyme